MAKKKKLLISIHLQITKHHQVFIVLTYRYFELYWKPEIDFDSSDYESKQVFFEFDGTKISMMITYKGLQLNGKSDNIL